MSSGTPGGAEMTHTPDVLETLAQLPNDEVFTPPKVANAMLDVLPDESWGNPDFRWLDPATKSGVFLREVFKRLMIGLKDWQPDPDERREHILRNMLYGAAVTNLSADIARRSLYQTKNATGVDVVDATIEGRIVAFDDPAGNVPFVRTEHTLDTSGSRCVVCRAPASLVRDRREHFAYAFTHNTYPTKEMAEMKFDVIVGNPPYQIGMDDGKGNRTANITPLYNQFVEKAISLNPRYIVMITPSRWFAGGKGLAAYRDKMIADRRISKLIDNPKQYDCFPQAEIKGGVSYFLWDRDHDGDCEFSTRINGVIESTSTRDLREGRGVILRDNFAAGIVHEVLTNPLSKKSLADLVSATDPFGQSIKTNFKGSQQKPFEDSIPLVFNDKIGYIRRDQLERNSDWVDRWKVLIPMAGDGHGRVPAFVLGEPIALAPGSACTQSYMVAGTFGSRLETENYARFLTTKFARFLVLQRKISQHLTPDRFAFVPWLDFTRRWLDEELYKQFNLGEDEVAYIERVIAPRDLTLSLDSSVPETHLPGGRKFKTGEVPADEDSEVDEG